MHCQTFLNVESYSYKNITVFFINFQLLIILDELMRSTHVLILILTNLVSKKKKINLILYHDGAYPEK